MKTCELMFLLLMLLKRPFHLSTGVNVNRKFDRNGLKRDSRMSDKTLGSDCF